MSDNINFEEWAKSVLSDINAMEKDILAIQAPVEGEPCSAEGCAESMVKPCTTCGRYQAGLVNGPDTDYVWVYLETLSKHNPVVYNSLSVANREGLDLDQTLTILLLALLDMNESLSEQLQDINRKTNYVYMGNNYDDKT